MTLKDIMMFLDYLFIILLGQRVDGFGMLTSEECIVVIRNLAFPQILKELEIYLNFTIILLVCSILHLTLSAALG